jgi:hypothetical protein
MAPCHDDLTDKNMANFNHALSDFRYVWIRRFLALVLVSDWISGFVLHLSFLILSRVFCLFHCFDDEVFVFRTIFPFISRFAFITELR